MKWAAGALAAPCVALLSTACGLVVDTSDYDEISLGGSLDSLGEGCVACLESRCENAFDACAANESCVRYADCRTRPLDPSRQWMCGATEQDFQVLLGCSACSEECALGRHFECVGRYVWPRPKTDTVHFQQRLLDSVDESRALSGVRVDACPPRSLDCAASSVASAMSDERGVYQFDLPVDDAPTLRARGFVGILLMRGDDIPVYELQVASPIFTDYLDVIRLFNREAFAFAPALGLNLLPDRAHLFFQVFDCARSGAEGIAIEVANASSEAEVRYVSDTKQGVFGSGTATYHAGDGLGVVLNLDPSPRFYNVTFREQASGLAYAHATISVSANALSVLRVEAGPSSEVSAW